MKLGEVFRFEVEYRLRHASTWVYGGILVALPFLFMHAINGAGGYMNAPWGIAFGSVVSGLLAVLVTAALFGDAATRDVAAGMHPLFYSAPIRRVDYLGGRFLGALSVNAVLLVGIPIGLLLSSWMPYMQPRKFGPFIAAGYVQAYLLFILPNLVLSAAILFTVAALTRSTLATYLAAVGLLIGYLLAIKFEPANPQVAAVLDPFRRQCPGQPDALLDSGGAEHPADRISRDHALEPPDLAGGRRWRARHPPPAVPVRAPRRRGAEKGAASVRGARAARGPAGSPGSGPVGAAGFRGADEGAADGRDRR
jgi:hypothetical protein